ncbi:NACHT domain-containing protein [Streptomyces phaeochromogenes]|uniref:NACHT domain-containing protein n=1 Tax=Streptomyces phaeochromogenes TaxID=1923 RepID=UPI0033E9690C
MAVIAGLAWYFRKGLDEAGDLADALTALVTSLTLPLLLKPLFVRTPASERAAHGLHETADQLATAVRRQWEAEAQVRRLNDPYALPVAWTALDTPLVESWRALQELARSWPGGPPGVSSTWGSTPDILAGEGNAIELTFCDLIPTRRLVILGEPGSGKSILLIRLLLGLLERRSPGEPVPVLLPIASWDVENQDLKSWIAHQLTQDHPALRERSSEGSSTAQSMAAALVEHRLLIPIMDGLDELPESLRSMALDRINEILLPGQPIVLASRETEYRKVVCSSTHTTTLLNGAAGIRLLPVDEIAAITYLRRSAGVDQASQVERWQEIEQHLGTGSYIGEVLGTPLGLSLAREIYNPRSGISVTSLPRPAELLNTVEFPDRETIRNYLFSAYVDSVYRPNPAFSSAWKAKVAKRYLVTIAVNLDNRLGATPNFAWWEICKFLNPVHRHIVVCLMFGVPSLLVCTPILTWMLGVKAGLAFALFTAFQTSIIASFSRPLEMPSLRWGWSGNHRTSMLEKAILGILNGLLLGFVCWQAQGIWRGVAALLIVPLVAIGSLGLHQVPPDMRGASGPECILRRDRRSFFKLAAVASVALVAFGAPLLPETNIAQLILQCLALLCCALFSVGPSYASQFTAWGLYISSRFWLAIQRKLPWRLAAFLRDAHIRRGILRQSGAVYQFRHIEIQRHLSAHR